MKKILLLATILAIGNFSTALAGLNNPFPKNNGIPFLVSPCSEKTSLDGKTELEFRWRPARGLLLTGADVRIFHGYQLSEGNLIYQEKTGLGVRSLSLPKEKFEKGETYTWMVREIYMSGRKSDPGICSFTMLD